MTELKPLLDLLSGHFGWLPTLLTWIAALKLAMTLFETQFAHWAADRLNAVAASSDEDDDAYLRQIFSAKSYRTVGFVLRMLGFRLPTLADLERAIKLQAEAVIDAGATLPAQRSAPALRRGPTGSILSLLALCGLCGLLFTVPSCSTPDRTAYAVSKSASITAEAALGAWDAYVAQYHPPLAQEWQVKQAFERYQAAQVALLDAAIIYLQTKDAPDAQTKLQAATAGAAAALADIISLVRTFGVKI